MLVVATTEWYNASGVQPEFRKVYFVIRASSQLGE